MSPPPVVAPANAPAAPVVTPPPAAPQPPPAPTSGPATFSLSDVHPGALFGKAKNLLSAGAAAASAPPLTQYTHHLGDFKPVADQALGWLQSTAKDPNKFGPLLGLAKPLVKPLVGNPLGLAALAGVRGLLSGPQGAFDAKTFFEPLVKKVSG